ncbi:MAG: DNA-processing protein DprA [Prevotella sp.]|nr:DNA-processing protein DprA [Prevotella sp.]
MDYNETLNAMTLARLSFYNLASIMLLYRQAGSATAVIENSNNIRDIIPDASQRLVELLKDCQKMRERAEEELEFDLAHGIKALDMSNPEYPRRLTECDDAPLVLYYKGNADLNATRVVNIVGTRKCTPYGMDLIRKFVDSLAASCPGVLVVSGLAYGVDICAHRQALERGLDTVGVLAHGLDDLYPHAHRATAVKMLGQGGLLTEFMTRTNADKINFVRRNRIVAGMSDACILVESAAHGGGLITADISRGYDREVFAFPGRVGDPYSEGCNNLIRDNGAILLTDASSFLKAMGWEGDASLFKARNEGIERTFFPQLSSEEMKVVNVLADKGDMQLNMLAVNSGLQVNQLTALLFELEMKGVVRNLAGGMYHLMPQF